MLVDGCGLFGLPKHLNHRYHIYFDVHIGVRQVGQRYAGCRRSGRHKVGEARMQVALPEGLIRVPCVAGCVKSVDTHYMCKVQAELMEYAANIFHRQLGLCCNISLVGNTGILIEWHLTAEKHQIAASNPVSVGQVHG
ncbi:uncharacterized protein METZ01_LOCUS216308, partial [marine metagenome]